MAQPKFPIEAPLLHAYCHVCGRWRLLDGSAAVLGGEARCPDCGQLGLVRARAPARRQHELRPGHED